MKLTKTQRKFRKEMAQAAKQFEKIYDNPYDQPYVRKKPSRGGWTFSVIFIAFIAFVIIWGSNNASDSPPGDIRELSAIPSVSSRGNVSSENGSNERSQANVINTNEFAPSLQVRVLSRSEANVLKQIDSASYQVELYIEAINQCNQNSSIIPLKDNEEYRLTLIDGIDACQQAKETITAINCPEQFANLKLIKIEAIGYIQQSYSFLLEYSSTGDNSLITQSNNFNQLATEKNRQYIFELEEYLKNNGYRYSVEGNVIRYWYSSSY